MADGQTQSSISPQLETRSWLENDAGRQAYVSGGVTEEERCHCGCSISPSPSSGDNRSSSVHVNIPCKTNMQHKLRETASPLTHLFSITSPFIYIHSPFAFSYFHYHRHISVVLKLPNHLCNSSARTFCLAMAAFSSLLNKLGFGRRGSRESLKRITFANVRLELRMTRDIESFNRIVK